MALVKARVKPHNTYGTHKAGDIIEVEAEEIAKVPHCLEDSAKADSERASVAKIAADEIAKQQALFNATRASFVAEREQAGVGAILKQEQIIADAKERLDKIEKTKIKK